MKMPYNHQNINVISDFLLNGKNLCRFNAPADKVSIPISIQTGRQLEAEQSYKYALKVGRRHFFLSTFFVKYLNGYVSFSLNLYFEKETGTSRYLIQNPFNFKIKNYSLD